MGVEKVTWDRGPFRDPLVSLAQWSADGPSTRVVAQRIPSSRVGGYGSTAIPHGEACGTHAPWGTEAEKRTARTNGTASEDVRVCIGTEAGLGDAERERERERKRERRRRIRGGRRNRRGRGACGAEREGEEEEEEGGGRRFRGGRRRPERERRV